MILFARIAVALLAAASLSLLVPPFYLGWLHWVALVPMMWAMREDKPRSNRWLGFLYGTFSVALLFRWLALTIMTFSNLHWSIATLAVLLFSIVFGLPYVVLWGSLHPLRRRLGSLWILAWPALQVVLEWGTMQVFLFPYNQGISQYRTPYVWQLASVTGVVGISFLILMVNAAIGEVIYRRREGKPLPVAWLVVTAVAVAGTLGFGVWRYNRVQAALDAAPVVRVGMIQTDLPMSHIFSRERYLTMFPRWVDDTRALIERFGPDAADLVVWSEGTYPGADPTDARTRSGFAELAATGSFDLLIGGGTDEVHRYPRTEAEWEAHRARDPDLKELRGRQEGDRWAERYNSVYLFGEDGEVHGRYDKTVPLPFGEYLPLSSTFPFLRDWIKGPGDFRAGQEATVIEGTHATIATPICYEAILPYMPRRFPEADMLVNPTNDGWFAQPGPEQHAMLATGRAIELGMLLVRAAYNGTSMVVLPHGDIIYEVPVMEPRVDIVPVPKATFDTPYKRFGDWFVALCAVFLVGSLVASPWLRRQSELEDEPPAPA